jgi:hypothetical protein
MALDTIKDFMNDENVVKIDFSADNTNATQKLTARFTATTIAGRFIKDSMTSTNLIEDNMRVY